MRRKPGSTLRGARDPISSRSALPGGGKGRRARFSCLVGRDMSGRILGIACLPAILALSPALAWADPAPGLDTTQGLDGVGTSDVTLPLSSLTGQVAPITLRNQSSDSSITIPLPADESISQGELHLLGAYSASLQGDESQLLISLNGQAVQQIPLKGGTPKIDSMITLPAAMFKPGNNVLNFSVTQKSHQDCEDFDAPQLWTQISPQSSMSLSYQNETPPLSFAQLTASLGLHSLRAMAADGTSTDPNVMILYDAGLARTPDAIMATAQSLALLYGHRPVRVLARPLDPLDRTMAQMFPGNIVVLSLAPPDGTASGPGARQASLTLARNQAGSAVLTITAPNAGVLAQAARFLGTSGFAWPDAPQALLDLPNAGAQPPAAPSDAAPDTMSFADAGFPIQTGYGREENFGPVTFWNSRWDSHAVLNLHLAYSAGAAPGSMIVAYLNGNMIGTIPLTDPAGGTYPDYKLLMPTDAMKVGENQLVLQPVFQTQDAGAGACVPYNRGQSLSVTLFSDSWLTTVGGSVVPPNDLAAVGAGVYPINTIAISDPTADVISAAATFGAKLAQVNHRAGVKMIDALPRAPSAGTLIIGTEPNLPRGLLQSAGLVAGPAGTAGIVERRATAWTPAVPAGLGSAVAWIGNSLGGSVDTPAEAASGPVDNGAGVMVGGFAGATILAIAQPTDRDMFAASAPAMIITAKDATGLRQGVAALVDQKLWTQLAGSAAVITPGATQLQTVAAMALPLGMLAQLGYLASRYPVLAILAICSFLIVLAVVIRILVSLRRRWLHPSVKLVDQK
jgi:cellulose synthase operon protein B